MRPASLVLACLACCCALAAAAHALFCADRTGTVSPREVLSHVTSPLVARRLQRLNAQQLYAFDEWIAALGAAGLGDEEIEHVAMLSVSERACGKGPASAQPVPQATTLHAAALAADESPPSPVPEARVSMASEPAAASPSAADPAAASPSAAAPSAAGPSRPARLMILDKLLVVLGVWLMQRAATRERLTPRGVMLSFGVGAAMFLYGAHCLVGTYGLVMLLGLVGAALTRLVPEAACLARRLIASP